MWLKSNMKSFEAGANRRVVCHGLCLNVVAKNKANVAATMHLASYSTEQPLGPRAQTLPKSGARGVRHQSQTPSRPDRGPDTLRVTHLHSSVGDHPGVVSGTQKPPHSPKHACLCSSQAPSQPSRPLPSSPFFSCLRSPHRLR